LIFALSAGIEMTFFVRNLKGEINKLPSLVEECLLPMDEEKDR
jgi:hypothetical protein